MNNFQSVTAIARCNIANQPTFDRGGFPLKIIETVAGKCNFWETLADEVTISINSKNQSQRITIINKVNENDVHELPVNPSKNTAGIVIQKLSKYLEKNNINLPWDLHIQIKKGISIRGTGLGSSGTSAAASLKAFEFLLTKNKVNYSLDKATKSQILMESDLGVPDNAIPAYFGGLNHIQFSNGKLHVEKIKKHPKFGYFVIVTPKGFGIKTTDARKVLEGHSAPANNEEIIYNLIHALRNGDGKKYGKMMEEAHSWFVGPRSKLYPNNGEIFDRVYNAAKNEGAYGVTIGGAGTTILAITPPDMNISGNIAHKMYNAFLESGFDSVARITDIDEEGARVSKFQ